MQPLEVYVDDETKLTLHGLQQHYVKLLDKEKNRKLFDLLDVLEFNQVQLTFGSKTPQEEMFQINLHLCTPHITSCYVFVSVR